MSIATDACRLFSTKVASLPKLILMETSSVQQTIWVCGSGVSPILHTNYHDLVGSKSYLGSLLVGINGPVVVAITYKHGSKQN